KASILLSLLSRRHAWLCLLGGARQARDSGVDVRARYSNMASFANSHPRRLGFKPSGLQVYHTLSPRVMAFLSPSPVSTHYKNTFILQFGSRRGVAFRDQCPRYSVSLPCHPPVGPQGLRASLTAPRPQNVI